MYIKGPEFASEDKDILTKIHEGKGKFVTLFFAENGGKALVVRSDTEVIPVSEETALKLEKGEKDLASMFKVGGNKEFF